MNDDVTKAAACATPRVKRGLTFECFGLYMTLHLGYQELTRGFLKPVIPMYLYVYVPGTAVTTIS